MSGIVLITGASRGIGAAAAHLAAQRGYDVAVNYQNNQDAAESVAEAVRKHGRKAIVVSADVSVEEQVVGMFEIVDAQLGKLSALVNNAGILNQQCRVEDMSAQRMQRIFAVNITGTLLCTREAIRRMSVNHGGQGGAIVNVSSRAAQLGAANEYVDYAASKGAVDTITIGLAKELAGDKIRVNTVRPGYIDTDMHASGGEPGRVARLAPTLPMGRGGTSEEVAEAILWLLSEQSSYSTGTFIDVSGGR
jgi:NAD(P)-dependent dehydrogenase (short-subunit alcohol dehydrogenase family)